LAQVKIAVVVGPEVLTGSTRLKAGTAQKLILNMISTASMAQLGKVYGNLMVDVQPSNRKLVDRATRIISEVAQVPYEQARHALEQANDETKTAVVMAALNLSPEEARQQLAQHQGFLRPILGR
jgi:N-acetylmuramic acid 6-phosphate etherase